eukprot:gnl/Spiro4/6181_TR3175_c0_g1_i1.p1 gnl/Spiro4/6181_TR3175_c0_g1~~gnl/Spiro4/6181_TR3175_c0_g1_i1.p1  ORF type:complete len:1015 (+),score=256.03 gnl/Spiro4/6181_TR3175_c0_g1_i1:48-3092(+)
MSLLAGVGVVARRLGLSIGASVRSRFNHSFTAGRVAGTDTFARRHIGPNAQQTQAMLATLGLQNIDELVDKTIPERIQLEKDLVLRKSRTLDYNRGVLVDSVEPANGKTESAALEELAALAEKNVIEKNYLGMGYHGTLTPLPILRNLLENPLWYTAYTPYQAEISQGRLESLLNFQTMVSDLTALPVANASLLDESTACAEAMFLAFNEHKRKRSKFHVDSDVHPQHLEVLRTRAEPLGVEIVVGNSLEFDPSDKSYCGALVSYPASSGRVNDYREFATRCAVSGTLVVAAADILSLTLLTPPGEWGADIAVGSTQRFGVPPGFGGPHAAYFAVKEKYQRKIPGRLIGVTKDSNGDRALRMALQTREQHIRRETATSNICTAQALLANTAAMYAVYHGPEGLQNIATRINALATILWQAVDNSMHRLDSSCFFDTVHIQLAGPVIRRALLDPLINKGINVRLGERSDSIIVSFDEKSTIDDVQAIVNALRFWVSYDHADLDVKRWVSEDRPLKEWLGIPRALRRTSRFLTQRVFNSYHSETELLRYMHHLASKDYSLAHGMIPLGSCTMKLNATAEMIPITWPKFNQLHPFTKPENARGYAEMIEGLQRMLSDITGMAATSLQPNSGASGEYAGLLAIRAYHRAQGHGHKNVVIIPNSAHGTNPASAAMVGWKIAPLAEKHGGKIDLGELRALCEKHKDDLAAVMITYPSTFGVFAENIREIIDMVHSYGGQVYMDGANMNAQVGLTSPGTMGADVCHLNLHKTFCIPHGGGGPGVGPICVKEHLAPFLPAHPVVDMPDACPTSTTAVSAAPYGSASILPITWMYITMMGANGLKKASQMAILNANYMAKRLEGHYTTLFKGENGTVAHEFILDIKPLKERAGISCADIAKRLQDYGIHGPTMSWPVHDTLMIEPTESESKYELDRVCDALIAIRGEIQEIIDGKADRANNLLVNAPHTAQMAISSSWKFPYPRERAVYPTQHTRERKFWPTVGRVDDLYGDTHLITKLRPDE